MRQTVNILNDLDDFIDEAAHGLNDVEMEKKNFSLIVSGELILSVDLETLNESERNFAKRTFLFI